VITVLLEIAPSVTVPVPSPQLSVTAFTESPLPAGTPGTIVKVAGRPALGAVVGAVIDSVSAAGTTVTDDATVTTLPTPSVAVAVIAKTPAK
jgi:predicted phage tail protein